MDVATMNFIRAVYLWSAFLGIVKHGTALGNIRSGYVPGIGGMSPIDERNCLTDEILNDSSLSNALECARSCNAGEEPKTCYYRFVLERYPINGQACTLCSPNVTNSICADCQCVPADGVERMALTTNRMIPGPTIDACKGDYVVIDVVNLINEEAVAIHWHGVFQGGSQFYDGVPYVTQCPIQAGNTFRYQFSVNNSGTHFWHAHTGLHKMDGIFGQLIVREPPREDPNSCLYQNDLTSHLIIISDWMHEESTGRFPGRTTGIVGQNPDSLLINGRGRTTRSDGSATNVTLTVFTVEPNQRYRFRLSNAFCTHCGGQLTIEGHKLTVISTDGQPVLPVEVDSINSFSGERYDFIINANQTSGSYWIQLRGLIDCNGMQQLAILQYADASPTPTTPEPTYTPGLPPGVILNPINGDCNSETTNAVCISELRFALEVDKSILKKEPDQKIYFWIGNHVYTPTEAFSPNRYPHFIVPVPNAIQATMINNISFTASPAPPLSQLEDISKDQFCDSENLPSNCDENFCSCTHMVKIKKNAVVEIVVVDSFAVSRIVHPFHMHGYHFHVIGMGQPLGPLNTSNLMTVEAFQELDRNNQIERNFDYPPGKDTIRVPHNGYAILRFHATNPGYWLFHCHIIYHQKAGMELILNVGEQEDLPKVPKGFPTCGNYVPEIKSRSNRDDE